MNQRRAATLVLDGPAKPYLLPGDAERPGSAALRSEAKLPGLEPVLRRLCLAVPRMQSSPNLRPQ